ncbi:MAG TPA: hypothetical protein GX707_13180 [Epulopiscium sp.]|nr:hypothetical protein [Candidatus Epulonipiscium sp.]
MLSLAQVSTVPVGYWCSQKPCFIICFIIGVLITVIMDRLRGLDCKAAMEYCKNIIMKGFCILLNLLIGFGIGTTLITLNRLTVSRFVGLISGLGLTALFIKRIRGNC